MFIADPDLEFLPISDPGSRSQKDTGTRIRNTGFVNLDRDSIDPGFRMAKRT